MGNCAGREYGVVRSKKAGDVSRGFMQSSFLVCAFVLVGGSFDFPNSNLAAPNLPATATNGFCSGLQLSLKRSNLKMTWPQTKKQRDIMQQQQLMRKTHDFPLKKLQLEKKSRTELQVLKKKERQLNKVVVATKNELFQAMKIAKQNLERAGVSPAKVMPKVKKNFAVQMKKVAYQNAKAELKGVQQKIKFNMFVNGQNKVGDQIQDMTKPSAADIAEYNRIVGDEDLGSDFYWKN